MFDQQFVKSMRKDTDLGDLDDHGREDRGIEVCGQAEHHRNLCFAACAKLLRVSRARRRGVVFDVRGQIPRVEVTWTRRSVVELKRTFDI